MKQKGRSSLKINKKTYKTINKLTRHTHTHTQKKDYRAGYNQQII